MTDSQRMKIVRDLWPAACRAQGWKVSDRERRLRTISDAVHRPVTSMLDLDNGGDIDAVFAHLRTLADNIDGAIESDHPEIGDKRRLFKAIDDLQSQLGYPYYRKIVLDRFGHDDLERLSVRELTQLRYTLTARTRAKMRKGLNVPTTVADVNPVHHHLTPASMVDRAADQPF